MKLQIPPSLAIFSHISLLLVLYDVNDPKVPPTVESNLNMLMNLQPLPSLTTFFTYFFASVFFVATLSGSYYQI